MRAGRAVVGFVIAGITLAAADAPQPPVSTEAEDAITKARRDLDMIKALRGASADAQKTESLRFNVPEMAVGSAAPTPSNLVPPKAKIKTPNWLVDAMAKKTDKVGEPKISSDGRAETNERDLATGFGGDEKPARASADEHLRREQNEAREISVNPLTAYMAGWMSPADYKLLKPSFQGADGKGAFTPSSEEPGAFRQLNSAGSSASERSLGPITGTRTSGVPPENPFLQTQAPLPHAPSATPPTPMAGVASTGAKSSAPLAVPPQQPRQSPSAKPDFMKAGDDAKYFKPLKKF